MRVCKFGWGTEERGAMSAFHNDAIKDNVILSIMLLWRHLSTHAHFVLLPGPQTFHPTYNACLGHFSWLQLRLSGYS